MNMPGTTPFVSWAEGEQYILFAASEDDADKQMQQVMKQQNMLVFTPPVPLESQGENVWHVPEQPSR